MSAIEPQPPVDWAAKLKQWEKQKEEAAKAVAAERLTRAELFAHFFPSPVEGTNTVELEGGAELKGKYPIDRKVDEQAWAAFQKTTVGECLDFLRTLNQPLDGVDPAMPVWQFMRMPVDQLVKWSPELSVTIYRKLTAEQKTLMDTCLTSKPGSIAIEIKPAKEPKQ